MGTGLGNIRGYQGLAYARQDLQQGPWTTHAYYKAGGESTMRGWYHLKYAISLPVYMHIHTYLPSLLGLSILPASC